VQGFDELETFNSSAMKLFPKRREKRFLSLQFKPEYFKFKLECLKGKCNCNYR
jgi:hypothetical protein